jgi:hypothetical protein
MEIASGLEGGETVVIEGNYALPDGTKVEPSESDKQKDDEGGDEKKGDEKKGDEKKGDAP